MGEGGPESNILSGLVGVVNHHPWLLPLTVTIILGILSLLVLFLALKTTILHSFVGTLRTPGRAPQQGQQINTQQEETTGLVVKKEINSFEEKMRTKSRKIVDAAESGELQQAVEKCKKFLSTIEASTFECKCELNSWEEIESVEQFRDIVDNIGKIMKLPEDNINGIKLAAGGKGAKRDTLAFECAMKDNGSVRLHTGGYQVEKHTTDQGDRIDFQIALHYLDMKDITFNKLPEAAVQSIERKWFQGSPALETQPSSEGQDWNTYFQYQAHKNILKELDNEE